MSDNEWEVIGVGPSVNASPTTSGADEWEVVGVGRNPQTYDESETGNWLNVLNALTLGFGDEIAGGGTALLDVLMGDNNSLGNAYDTRLKQARELRTGFKEENPGAALVQDVIGGAMLPAGKLVSGAKGFVPKVGAAAIEGAGFGGAYGFGEGEGGFQNRLDKGIESARTGALLSGALSTPFAAVESFSPFLNKAGQAMKRKSLGATQADYTRTANELQLISEGGELGTKTKKALDSVLQDSQVAKTTNPAELLQVTKDRERELAGTIRKFIDKFDENRTEAIEPSYNRAAKYIEKKVPADQVQKYRERLSKFKEAVQTEGNGSLGYIQDQKIALGELWDPNDSIQNGYFRELYGDLQNTIEKHFPDVKGLNDDLSNWMIAKKVFQRGVAKAEAQSLPETLRGLMRTSGGFGVPFLAGMYSGNPLLGILGGAAGAYATSPSGQRAIGSGLQMLSKTQMPTQIAPLVAALVNSGGGNQESNLLSSLQSPELAGQYEATHDQGQGQTAQDYSLQGQIPKLLERSLLEQGGRGIQGSSADTFKQELEKRLGFPTDYRQAPSTTQGENTDMYNPVKYKGKEIPIENLVMAVGGWETRGLKDKDSAVSPKGAGGFMQVMPATAKEVLAELGEDPESWNPKDREMNLRVGSHYLNKMLDQFKDIRLALAAYNAGPGQVQQWIKRFGSKDWDVLSRRLKDKGVYKETVDYVPGVLKKLEAIEV